MVSFFRARGFTLIELLIVVAIIAILAAIAVPNMLEAQTRAKVSATRSDQRTMMMALEMFRMDHNKYPLAFNCLPPWGDPGEITETWRLTTPISYLTTIPRDLFYAPQEFGTPGGLFGPGGEYVHYISDPIVTETWLVWSYGPDQVMEYGEEEIIHYDPTNGTVSRGDIYRVGVIR